MPAVVIAANNLMPALRERLAGGGRSPHIRRHRADPGAADDPGAAAGADRPRTPVRGDAARRGAHQPDQDRPAARTRRGTGDVAHRRLLTRRCRNRHACSRPAHGRRRSRSSNCPTAPAPEAPAPRLDWQGTRRARTRSASDRASRSSSMAIPPTSSISRLSACRCCRRRFSGRIRASGSAFRTKTS